MAPAAASFAFAASFPAFFAGEALAQARPEQLPSSVEVGQALAVANSCRDLDGMTLCSPSQPAGATFREILCVVYGADAEHRPIVRCVYKGAKMEIRTYFRNGPRSAFLDYGDGAIDLTYVGGHWLPTEN